MTSFQECWLAVAPQLLSKAYPAGAQLLPQSSPQMDGGWVCYSAEVEGALRGQLVIALDKAGYESGAADAANPLALVWPQLLEDIARAACNEMQRREGVECRLAVLNGLQAFDVSKASSFRLTIGAENFVVLLSDHVRIVASNQHDETGSQPHIRVQVEGDASAAKRAEAPALGELSGHSPNMDLLLDVELEASLRFGSREMPLSEILELGPGDVVQLDRHIADPVDLIVGDKIVARGEVVLVNGNFGLRVTEVAEPRKRLESIRCLF